MRIQIEVVRDLINPAFFLPSTGSQGTKTFFNTGINDWNSLPNSIKETKHEDLVKEKVKAHLIMETKMKKGKYSPSKIGRSIRICN